MGLAQYNRPSDKAEGPRREVDLAAMVAFRQQELVLQQRLPVLLGVAADPRDGLAVLAGRCHRVVLLALVDLQLGDVDLFQIRRRLDRRLR